MQGREPSPQRATVLSGAGWVIPFFALSLTVILAFVALAIDVGVTLFQQRRLQMATDAASLAAAETLPAIDAVVSDEVVALAQANGANISELGTIVCGVWNSGSFSPSVSCNSSGVNAIRVPGVRSVDILFGRILGVTNLFPAVVSTAVKSGGQNCVRPIGVQQTFLDQYSQGNLFVLNTASNGNWGKLDIDGNMSSGQNFRNAMLSNTCSGQVVPSSDVSTGTGFGGSISHVLDDVIQQHLNTDMVLPVTTTFPNGNGLVTIQTFAKVDLLYQQGNGNNWQATFRLVEYPTTPPTGGAGGGRKLVM